MVTHPFKLTYRYSPLAKELAPGLKRELRFIFGDRVTFDPAERFAYSRDTGALPADLVDLALKRRPFAVVVPRSAGDLVEALRLAERHGLPVTPRGNGTSTNGAAVPAEGGIAVDMRALKGIGPLDKAAGLVACGPGATFEELRRFLAPHGLAPLVEPELPWASTVGGSVALGRFGAGSAAHGSIADQCVRATVLTPDRRRETWEGDALELLRGMQGCTGIVLSATLRVGPALELEPFLASFEAPSQAARAFAALAALGPHHLAVLSPGFVALRQEASGVKGLQERWHVLAAFPRQAGEGPRVEEAVRAAQGKLLEAKAAQREWGQRSGGIAIHRLGPTVLRAECLVPAARLAEALEALPAAARGTVAVDAFAVAGGRVLVRVHVLEDERRLEFSTSLGNLYAIVDAARRLGGHAAYPSLLLAGEAKRALGEERWRRLARFKRERDPWEVMNPGKVWPSRMRATLMPLPLFLRTQKPILKALRGAVPYKGLGLERAGDQAIAAALGRARCEAVAEFGDALYTCSHCALCNTASPDVGAWETLRPRGMVLAARALLEGEARWTEHLREHAFRLPLHRGGDAVCPSRIPLLEASVAVRTEAVRALGPLPAHEAIAAAVQREGNPLGRPRAERGAWLPEGFQAAKGAKVLYYAGCRAAYGRPRVARVGLELLARLGPVNALGAQEPCCGHTLLWTGQREAAARQAAQAIKALQATGAEVLVTPDPECARTMREFWPRVAEERGLAWSLEAQHEPEFLLPRAGKDLALPAQAAEAVHFTEPCAASDASGLKLLQKVPGLKVTALPILPCGAPGGLREAFPDVAQLCAARALEAARAAGASVLVTSSPLCEAWLAEQSAAGQWGIAVLDVLEVVARAAGIPLPEAAAPAAGAPAPRPAAVAPAKPKLDPEELEARKRAALEKAAAAKAARERGGA